MIKESDKRNARRHTEDLDLHSVNYLHFGAPKSWYCISPAHRDRFEALIKGMLPDMFRVCPEFLRHKVTDACRPLPRSMLLFVLCCPQTSATRLAF